MNATTTKPKAGEREARRGAVEATHRGPGAVLRDPTAPAQGTRTPHVDDRTHTPPHGDALLRRAPDEP
jgi:hypothetical protein